jgi:serpin B
MEKKKYWMILFIGILFVTSVLTDHSAADSLIRPEGAAVSGNLRIGAMIDTQERGIIEAIWKEGGRDTTERGDKVIWGHFYADPEKVSWGTPENPDLFVKIWFDKDGRADVNFFHVSVPDIHVYSEFPIDGNYDFTDICTLDQRYIRHEYHISPSMLEGLELVRSQGSHETSPDATQSEISELAEGTTDFAMDFYQMLAKADGNIICSPYSISLALAMTYAGAANETAQQLADTLHFTLSQNRLHAVFNALNLDITSQYEHEDEDCRIPEVNIHNALWGQTDYTFLPSFLDVLGENYDAGITLLDFRGSPEDSRRIINEQISEQTRGRVGNFLPRGSVTSDTRLVLTNSIFFRAFWLSPFRPENTAQAPFYLLAGSSVNSDMMLQTGAFRYMQGDQYQAVELLYDGSHLSMLILVPDAGAFPAVESLLTRGLLADILENLEWKELKLRMPKFEYESDAVSLRNTLARMGMAAAFSETADFSGMTGYPKLCIGDVFHQAFISADEKGTEAAAASAVVMPPGSSDLPVLNIDRPFIFFIRDTETGIILFMGRMVSPAEN